MNAGHWNKEIYHVDKTLIVKTFLEVQHRIHLITAPQGFLKTSNLRLLAAFFDITSDAKVDTYRRRLFEKTKIMSQERIVREFFGKFPTIFIAFKQDETYDLPKMKEMVQQLYEQYEFLLSSSRLNRDDKKKFSAYINSRPDVAEINETARFSEAISVLCDLLHKHYEKKVYVFIDNYDAPILNAISNDRILYNYLPFLERMLSSIIACKSLNRLIMTGMTSISRIATVKIAEFKFLTSNKYAKYFGFTESDLQELAVRCSAEVIEDLEKGCYYTACNTRIYSPEWVLSHLNYSPIENPYWYGEILKKKFFHLPVLKMKIRLLLLGHGIKFHVNKCRSMRDLWLINKLVNSNYGAELEDSYSKKVSMPRNSDSENGLEESDMDLLFSVFLEFGLLTFTRRRRRTTSISFSCMSHDPKSQLLLNEANRGCKILKIEF